MPVSDPHHGFTPAVVILTFRPAAGMLEDAVRSLLDRSPGIRVVVVDNGGSALSLLAAGVRDDRPLTESVELVVAGRNGGYGAGMNLGMRTAFERGADVVVLLNDDIVVTDGWLEPLLRELAADPLVAAAQPLLVNGDRPDSASAGHATVNSAGVLIDRFGAGHDARRDRPVAEVDAESSDIDAFTGGAVALRRAFVDDVGPFDERFFLYYEDVELSRRGRRSPSAWRYRLVPTSRVVHRGSASTSAMGDEVRRLQERNRLWSAAMHGSPAEIVDAVAMSVRRLRHPPHRVHRRALVQGLGGMPGRLAPRIRPLLPLSSPRSKKAMANRLEGTPGINVVGYHHISSGLGSIARELTAALTAAGIPFVEIDNDLSTSPRRRTARPVPDVVYDTTVAIVTAFEFGYFCHRFPQLAGPGRRMIGCWLWELEEIPEQHREAMALVDEIWAPTTFVRDAYDAATDGRVPVRLAPFRMPEPAVDPVDIARWRSGWGADVVFVVSFDYLSIVERKNPHGAIAAFRRAFDGSELRVRLIVKSINGDQRPDDAAATAAACGDDARIELLDEHLDDDRHHALLAAADCFVSLHRSEGYGLHPAIAMWLGTVVVATRYSGVLDFLDDSCAAMVDATMVHVANGQGIYPETATWADPSIDQAAAHMHRLAVDPVHRGDLAERARRRIAGQPSSADFGEGYASILRTPPSERNGPEAFFAGLDAARRGRFGRLGRLGRFGRGEPAWPDTIRRIEPRPRSASADDGPQPDR